MKQSKKTIKPATKKAANNKFKLDPKREAKMDAAMENFEEEEEGGKVKQILFLYVKGFTPQEIIAYGYNRTTVYRQTNDYKKLRKAPALEYMGYELFESRVRRYMQAKKVTRDKAVDVLIAKDLE